MTAEERKPLSVFVRQKTPDNKQPKVTSSDVKAKLIDVLDNMSDVHAVTALKKAMDEPEEKQQGDTSIPKPWEGLTEMAKVMGLDLGQMSRDRDQNLKDAREATDAKDKELFNLRVELMDNKVAELRKMFDEAEAKTKGNGGNPQGDRHGKLDDAIDNFISNKLEAIFGGGNQAQLTKEDVQNIVVEAVNASKAGQNTPQSIADTLVSFVTAADEAKKKMVQLGGGQGDGNPYLNAGNMRTDMLKVLLDNDLAKLRLQQEHDIAQQRTNQLGALAGTVKDNIEAFVSTGKDAVNNHRNKRREPRPGSADAEEQGGYAIGCSECGQQSIYPEMPSGTFDCQHCGAKLKLREENNPPPQNRKPPPPNNAVIGLEF